MEYGDKRVNLKNMDAPFSIKAQEFFSSNKGKEFLSDLIDIKQNKVYISGSEEIHFISPDDMDLRYLEKDSVLEETRNLENRLKSLLGK